MEGGRVDESLRGLNCRNHHERVEKAWKEIQILFVAFFLGLDGVRN